MKNLAGVADCDVAIEAELKEAGIKIVRNDFAAGNEVSSKLIGTLSWDEAECQPRFIFQRAWRYWIVKGRVPLAIAERLYADPVGAKSIRVAGLRGCPSPADWAIYRANDGRLIGVMSDYDREAFRKYDAGELSELLGNTIKALREEVVFVDSKEERVALAVDVYVDVYRIDTQEALNLFAKTLGGRG